MQRAEAESMMACLQAMSAPSNGLSMLCESLQGEEKTWFLRQTANLMGAAAGMWLEIGHQFPDLDPDKRGHA